MSYVISKACTNCGACISKCPTQSITVGALQYVIDADTCDNFGACVTVCPVNAIAPAPSRLEEFRKKQKSKENSPAKTPAGKPGTPPRPKSPVPATQQPASTEEHVISGSIEAILKEYE